MIGLVDVDPVIYASAFSVEKRRKVKNEDGSTEHVRDVAPLNHALQNARTMMDAVINKFDSCRCFVTGKGNWRHEAATIKPYKGNRGPFSRPVHYKEVRRFLIDKYHSEVIDGMEADDALGIAQTSAEQDTTCIVSIDKDLDMIPGHHYNPRKNISYYIKEPDGLRNFYKQCLTGDTVDNIPGIFGVGPATATKLLAGYSKEHAMWQVVLSEWVRNYPDGISGLTAEQAAKECASLLWIARAGRERWSTPE
jgi:hypothetical protein